MLQSPRKNANGVSLQSAQIDRRIGRRLHLQRDAFQASTGELNLPPGCQYGAAVGGLNECVLAGIDAGAEQDYIAAARQDVALNRHARRRRTAVTKTQAPGQCVGVAHQQRRRGKAGGVHHGTGTHGDAGLIDQHQIAVAAQRAKKE